MKDDDEGGDECDDEGDDEGGDEGGNQMIDSERLGGFAD